MTLKEAQHEFAARFYVWAASAFESEIELGFPAFRSFRSGSVWECCEFMKRLSRAEQLKLAHGCLKETHREAVEYLGENASIEELTLCSKLYAFWRIQNLFLLVRQLREDEYIRPEILRMWNPEGNQILGKGWEQEDDLRQKLEAIYKVVPPSRAEEIAARGYAGEKVNRAPRRSFRRTILRRFKEAFGNECFELACVGMDPDLAFKMKCCGWLLTTHFDFTGRSDCQLEYWHSLTSPAAINHHGQVAAINRFPMSFVGGLGVGKATWEYLEDSEVEPTCEAVLNLCRRFFEVAPNLLKGLHYESLTDVPQS